MQIWSTKDGSHLKTLHCDAMPLCVIDGEKLLLQSRTSPYLLQTLNVDSFEVGECKNIARVMCCEKMEDCTVVCAHANVNYFMLTQWNVSGAAPKYMRFTQDHELTHVTCLKALNEGLLACGTLNSVIICNGELVSMSRLHANGQWASHLEMLPHNRVVGAFNDGSVLIWDCKSSNCLKVVEGCGMIGCVRRLNESIFCTLVFVNEKRYLRIFESQTYQCFSSVDLSALNTFFAMQKFAYLDASVFSIAYENEICVFGN